MSRWPSRDGAESNLMRADSDGPGHEKLPWATSTGLTVPDSSPRASPYAVRHPQRSLKRRSSLTKVLPSSVRFRAPDMSDSPGGHSPGTPSSSHIDAFTVTARRSLPKTRPRDISGGGIAMDGRDTPTPPRGAPARGHGNGSRRESLSPTVTLVFPTHFPAALSLPQQPQSQPQLQTQLQTHHAATLTRALAPGAVEFGPAALNPAQARAAAAWAAPLASVSSTLSVPSAPSAAGMRSASPSGSVCAASVSHPVSSSLPCNSTPSGSSGQPASACQPTSACPSGSTGHPSSGLPAPAESDRFWGGLIRFARAQLGPPFSGRPTSVRASATTAAAALTPSAGGTAMTSASATTVSNSSTTTAAAAGPPPSSLLLPAPVLPIPTVLLLAPRLLHHSRSLSLRLLPLDASAAHPCLLRARDTAAPDGPGAPPRGPQARCPPASWAARSAGLPVCAAAVGVFAGVPSLVLALCPEGLKEADVGVAEAVLAIGGAGAGTSAGTGAGAGAGGETATAGNTVHSTTPTGDTSGGLFVWAIAHGPGLTRADVSAAKCAHAAARSALAAAAGPQLQALAGQPDTATVVSALTSPALTQFLVADSMDSTKVFRVTQNVGGSWVGSVVMHF